MRSSKKTSEKLGPRTSKELTLFPEDSLVSPLVKPGNGRERTITVISGQKCLELSERFNHPTLLAKMLLASSIWKTAKHLSGYSTIWKMKGITTKYLLFHLQVSERGIKEKGFGFIPTPLAVDHKRMTRDFQKKIANLKRDHQTTLIDMLQLHGLTDTQIMEVYESQMGYPIGWTDLNHSETPSSHK